jgi:hypothetical protein
MPSNFWFTILSPFIVLFPAHASDDTSLTSTLKDVQKAYDILHRIDDQEEQLHLYLADKDQEGAILLIWDSKNTTYPKRSVYWTVSTARVRTSRRKPFTSWNRQINKKRTTRCREMERIWQLRDTNPFSTKNNIAYTYMKHGSNGGR